MLLFSLLVLVLELASAVKAATNQTTNQSSLKKEEEFVIKLGSLHTIYHRGKNERCDRDRLYGSSVQVRSAWFNAFLAFFVRDTHACFACWGTHACFQACSLTVLPS